jgi:hypothetical protein
LALVLFTFAVGIAASLLGDRRACVGADVQPDPAT